MLLELMGDKKGDKGSYERVSNGRAVLGDNQ